MKQERIRGGSEVLKALYEVSECELLLCPLHHLIHVNILCEPPQVRAHIVKILESIFGVLGEEPSEIRVVSICGAEYTIVVVLGVRVSRHDLTH